MADIEFREGLGGYGDDAIVDRAAGKASFLGTLANWAGAVISIGLVIGMVVWAWQLTVRDVSGVPVIQALEGPMRVAPENPGGAQAPHQGLAVNRIAEGAEAAPVPDQLVLAPPPVDLEALDVTTAPAAEDEADSGTQGLIDRIMSRGPEAEVASSSASEAEATSEARAGVSPEAVAEAIAIAVGARTASSVEIIPASVPGVSRSLRPVLRPSSLTLRDASVTSAATGERPALEEVDAASLPEGTRLVQLGAFDTPDLARQEWQRLAAQFPDFFLDRARVVQAAGSEEERFYRLRAHGFDDLAASRRFCAALRAQDATCIPVTVR